MALRHGAPSPMELLEWELAERFHWTLDYIRGLPVADLHAFLQIEEARRQKAETERKLAQR